MIARLPALMGKYSVENFADQVLFELSSCKGKAAKGSGPELGPWAGNNPEHLPRVWVWKAGISHSVVTTSHTGSQCLTECAAWFRGRGKRDNHSLQAKVTSSLTSEGREEWQAQTLMSELSLRHTHFIFTLRIMPGNGLSSVCGHAVIWLWHFAHLYGKRGHVTS